MSQTTMTDEAARAHVEAMLTVYDPASRTHAAMICALAWHDAVQKISATPSDREALEWARHEASMHERCAADVQDDADPWMLEASAHVARTAAMLRKLLALAGSGEVTARSSVHTTPAEVDEIGALVDERLIPMHDVGYAETLRAADALVRIWPEYLALRAAILGDVSAPVAAPAPRPFLRPLGATPPHAGELPAGA